MARYLEFIGTVPSEEGRHGILQPGQVIEVTEDEFHTGLDSDRFRRVPGDPATSFEDCPPPSRTQDFDLTSISWTRRNLSQILRRKSKPTLNRIGKAVEEVSGVSIPYGNGVQRSEIAEAVLSVAVDFGWTSKQ